MSTPPPIAPRRVPGAALNGQKNGLRFPSWALPKPQSAKLQPVKNKPIYPQAQPLIAPAKKSRLVQLPKLKLPKFNLFALKDQAMPHWRYVSAVTIAVLVAVVGFDYQFSSGNAVASESGTVSTQPKVAGLATDRFGISLPTVKSVVLAPVPIKKATAVKPYIQAKHAILIDDATKLPLFEQDADSSVAVASTTKIVSAIVALEHFKSQLNEPVAISELAINQIGSAVGYRKGETATPYQMLQGLGKVSGNDAAMQLAMMLSKPTDTNPSGRFVAEMNRLAVRLGATQTHFADPAGLDDLEGRSTAREMAKFLSAAVAYPELKEIFGTAEWSYRSPEGFLHNFKSSSRLVTPEMRYPGIMVTKTGFTPLVAEGGAGHCMVAVAQRNGHRLIAVVLNTYQQTPEASAVVTRDLLDYGFNNYEWQTVLR